MQIGFSCCKIDSLWSCYDADVDISPAGLWNKGIEDFVIVDEEVDVEPKGICEDYFGEF